jgi:hypothetical protein
VEACLSSALRLETCIEDATHEGEYEEECIGDAWLAAEQD